MGSTATEGTEDEEQTNHETIFGRAIGMELDTEERPFGRIQVQNGNCKCMHVQQVWFINCLAVLYRALQPKARRAM